MTLALGWRSRRRGSWQPRSYRDSCTDPNGKRSDWRHPAANRPTHPATPFSQEEFGPGSAREHTSREARGHWPGPNVSKGSPSAGILVTTPRRISTALRGVRWETLSSAAAARRPRTIGMWWRIRAMEGLQRSEVSSWVELLENESTRRAGRCRKEGALFCCSAEGSKAWRHRQVTKPLWHTGLPQPGTFIPDLRSGLLISAGNSEY